MKKNLIFIISILLVMSFEMSVSAKENKTAMKETAQSVKETMKETGKTAVESGKSVTQSLMEVKEKTDKVVGKVLGSTVEPLILEPLAGAKQVVDDSLPENVEFGAGDVNVTGETEREMNGNTKLKVRF